MAKAKTDFDEVKDGDVKARESVVNLTAEHKKTLEWLINEYKILADKKKQYADDVKGFAEKLGTKGGKINKVITLIIQEEEKGGILKEQNSAMEWVTQYLDKEVEK